jgi:MSHA biogenesis protein MshI
MLSFFSRGKKKPKGFVFVNFRREGVAISYVSPENVLEHVDFLACDDISMQAKLLKDRVFQQGWTNYKCSCILQSSDYRLLFLDAPNVNKDELKAASHWLIKDLIDYPLTEAAIDVFPVNVKPGQQEKVYIVSMRQSVLQHRADTLYDSGLDVTNISISEIAIARLLSLSKNAKYDVAIMYMDTNNVHVLICRSGSICMVRDVGDAKFLSEESGFGNILLEVQRSLDFYQSHLGGVAPSTLYFTPRVAAYTAFCDCLVKGLALSVKALSLQEIMPGMPSLPVNKLQHCMLVLGAAKRHQMKVESIVTGGSL